MGSCCALRISRMGFRQSVPLRIASQVGCKSSNLSLGRIQTRSQADSPNVGYVEALRVCTAKKNKEIVEVFDRFTSLL
jgi:hypothetical protein